MSAVIEVVIDTRFVIARTVLEGPQFVQSMSALVPQWTTSIEEAAVFESEAAAEFALRMLGRRLPYRLVLLPYVGVLDAEVEDLRERLAQLLALRDLGGR